MPETKRTVISLLKRARALITPRCLVIEMAMLPNGISTHSNDPNAIFFCPIGAILHLTPEYGRSNIEAALRVVHAQAKEAGAESMGGYTYRHSHREVLDLYDKAIASVRKSGIPPAPIRKKKCKRMIYSPADAHA